VDIATSSYPEETKQIFPRTADIGIEHGTVLVLDGDEEYEVTTFRTEDVYVDYRRPSAVSFVRSLEEDLKRRDFTVNAFALDETGEIIDLFYGLEDLEKQVLRAVGVASERFNEDALRIMRGFRFQASLGFELEPETFKAMKTLTPLLEKISVERTFVEFDKLLLAPFWRRGLASMIESQAYDYLPDMESSQDKLNRLFDLETDFIFESSEQAWSALLSALEIENAQPFLKAWKTSRQFAKQVQDLLTILALREKGELSKRDCYRFDLNLLLQAENLRQAQGKEVNPQAITETYQSLTIHDKKEIQINGGILIKEYGYQPGPDLGEILTEIEYKMSDFIVEKLSKSVGDKTVFKDISFIIHDLDRIGLIGVNGTGKTTLLDVLSGVSGFDGDVSPFSAKNDYQIGYLTQDPDFDDSKTVLDTVLSSDLKEIQLIREYELIMLNYSEDKQARLERVMAEMDSLQAWEIESQVKTVLSKLGIQDLSTPVGELSGGLRRRVQLAQVLLGNHDLLLLDEPTNHLDIATIEWLTLFLKNSKKTVLFITHDRYFLDALSTRIFELDRAGLTEYQGNYQDYVRLKAEQDERDAALLHKKEQLYKQELAWMRRQPQARATKQQARINRFHDLKKEVSGGVAETDLTMNFETSRIGKKVIEFQDVSFAYENKPILQDFNLLVQAKDRIGIVGDNGVGKSTLLNLIAGILEPTAGQVVIGETVRIAYFSQQIEGLDESKRVINYLQEVAEEVKTSGGSTTSIAELLEQFLFPRSTHGTLIEKLSGGEKKRLYLLKLLLEKPNVLLLDEPTNDLDIATLTVLENFLQGFAGPVLTVSHDRYFLDKVATKILAFEDGKIRPFFGHYTDYLDEKAFETEMANQVQKAEKEKVVKVREDKKRMTYQEKQEWASIEGDIEALENRIAAIEEEMQANGSDFSKLATLQKELDEKNEALLEKYERYEYLSEFDS